MVGRIDSLSLRGVSPQLLRMNTAADDKLYGLDWIALPSCNGGAGDIDTDRITVLRCPTTISDSCAVPAGIRRTLTCVLDRVQSWLSGDRHDDARLVVLTHGAVAVEPSEDVSDLGQAAVWGLLRSAQTENPGLISLADVDDWAGIDAMSPKPPISTNPNSHSVPGGCFAPRLVHTERIEGAELVESARGGWPPSVTARWTPGTSSCARGPNPDGLSGPARCAWVCAAPV